MSSPDSFIVVLPANASFADFPSNRNGSYKVRLAERLRLDGSAWKIALLDIFYPNNWHNVKVGKLVVKKMTSTPDGLVEVTTEINVRKGRYRELSDLLREVRNSLEVHDLERDVALIHDDIRDYVFLMMASDEYSVEFSADLAGILGFSFSRFQGYGGSSAID